MPDDFRPVAACFEAVIEAQDLYTQSKLINVFHVQSADLVPTSAELAVAKGVFTTWVTTVYAQIVAQDIIFTALRFKALNAAVASFDSATLSQAGGGVVYDELSHAPLITLRGSQTSANQEGGVYLFPPYYAPVLQSGYGTVYWINAVAAINNLRANLATNGLQLAIASRDRGVCYRVTNVGHTNRLTMQKRRRQSFGR